MTSLRDHCLRPLPIPVRIELFCRVIAALESMGRRRQRPSRLDPANITFDGDVVGFGAVESVVGGSRASSGAGGVVGGVVGVDGAGLLAVADLIFALEPGRLVRETSPGAPWVLEHVVARLRADEVLPLPVVLKALESARARLIDSDDNDDSGLQELRRSAAVALVQQATKLATAIGPAAPVLFALDEACRVDPDFGDPVERRRRIGETLGVDANTLRAEVLRDMHAVLEQRDPAAAARVATVLHGPGSESRIVLQPLGAFVTLAPIERHRQPAAAAVVLGVAVVVVVAAVAVVGFVVGFRAGVEPVAVAPPTQGSVAPVVDPVVAPAPARAVDVVPAVSDLPVPGPAIVNVWLESCVDCMPTFRAWSRLAATGAVDRSHLYNYAYGDERASTRAFAAAWLVDDNLRFDPTGALVVHKNGIATFTTLVIDEKGAVVWKGRAVDAGFKDDLAAAWQRVAPPPPTTTTAMTATTTTTATLTARDVDSSLLAAQKALLNGEYQNALTVLLAIERVAPGDARIQRSLGICHARLRDNQKAAAHYRRYLQLAPDAPDADKVREILKAR